MKEVNKGYDLVKLMVIATDFAILNFILFLWIYADALHVPECISQHTKIAFFALNVALFFGETFFSSIILTRKVQLWQVFKRTAKLLVTTVVISNFITVYLSKGGYDLMRFSVYYTIVACIILFLSRALELYIIRYIRSKGKNIKTVIFVGNDPAVVEMYLSMTENNTAGYKVLGYYADAPIENEPEGLQFLGDMNLLRAILEERMDDTINGMPRNINDAICCLSHTRREEIRQIMEYCDNNVIHFYYLPRKFKDQELHLKPQNYLGTGIYTNHTNPLLNLGNRMAKRTFDIVVSGLVCLCILPFLPIIAIIIKCQSPGPLFFKQKRTGLDGRIFECYKFRSMHVNKDSDLAQATENDPRKFAFGNFMRKANIDEFPQFFNVLKGDMSIVGPRPHMLHHTEVYGNAIKKYMVRHFYKPGITGLAQVTGFRGETKELWQMEERVKRDIWYIENWSFWLDIKIMYLTAKSIFIHDENAY